MRLLVRTKLIAAVALLVPACGGGDTVQIQQTVQGYDLYVDASLGNDANGGTSDSPLKTITRALTLSITGDYIKVAPGTYNAANGESFPMTIPPAVRLIGDEPTKGQGSTPTIISGAGAFVPGSVCILMSYGSVLAGFTITHPGPATAMVEAAVGFNNTSPVNPFATVIRNNSFINSASGGGGNDAALHMNFVADIQGNDIRSNGTGILFMSGSSGRVENNIIRNNGVGVRWTGTNGPHLGGAGSPAGGNVLSSNTTVDVTSDGNTGFVIQAQNCFWDHVPPSGNDILLTGSDTLNTTGAQLAPNPTP